MKMYRLDPGWGSHIPVLVEILRQTKGPVLEMGMGHSSTILLHMLCADQGRKLVSYDNSPEIVNMFKRFRTRDHEIHLVDWDTSYPGKGVFFDVALIDEGPAEQRIKSIVNLVDNVRFFVLHDTEDPIYNYEKIYPMFRYRFDYKKFRTHVTVLSHTDEFVWQR